MAQKEKKNKNKNNTRSAAPQGLRLATRLVVGRPQDLRSHSVDGESRVSAPGQLPCPRKPGNVDPGLIWGCSSPKVV